MSTQKVKPDPGSLDRQQAQRRRSVGKRVGEFAVAAVIGLVAAACTPGTRDGQMTTAPAEQPPTAYRADPQAEEIATSFVEAVGAFDTERAVTHLADDAIVPENLLPEELPILISFYEAQGYKQMLDPCEVTGSYAHGTVVRCTYDFHAIRSDEIGLGPYYGSHWDITISDGEIVEALQYWEIEDFSPQMWEPFADWVSATYPKDFEVMYTGGRTNFSLTEESIRLWRQHTREYVRVAIATGAENGEVDYVIDLNTGEMNPLPQAILRSLGPDGRRPFQSPGQYAASPDGSRLAYVGTGDGGSLQIFTSGIDGTGVRQVTHDPTGAISPAWSPDGTTIAYVGNSSSFDGNLFVLDVRTGEATKITDETGVSGPQFTPDGSSLLYAVYSRVEGVEAAVLRIVPLTGGKGTPLFDPQARGFGYTGEGSLSPDGSLVTFMGHRIGGPGAIRFVANADGTDWRSIGSCISNPSGTWSPDGSRIVCGPNGPPPGIRVKNIATGHTTFVAKGQVAIWLDDHTLLVDVTVNR